MCDSLASSSNPYEFVLANAHAIGDRHLLYLASLPSTDPRSDLHRLIVIIVIIIVSVPEKKNR
jgi:hypothetical protein